MKIRSSLLRAVLVGSLLGSLGLAHAAMSAGGSVTVVVPGDANPWLAGMPAGSTASGDSVPQPPVQVLGLDLSAAGYLSFNGVTGQTSYSGGCPAFSCYSADGDVSGETDYLGGSPGFINRAWAGYTGGENGISDVTAPLGSLIGVYMDNSQPDPGATPGAFDFRVTGLDFSTLSPVLNQAFFIGDGLTPTGDVQRFIVPVGATRLYLGTMDGFGWTGNNGALGATVLAAVPEPDGFALLLCGLALMAAVVRGKNTFKAA